ncbi:MAG: thiamine pyrophosphate-binding protein [Chloroflexi bacterium]|nr:thiamine pyrophosphate-binding protein [Chloroflexota bacterium]MCH2531904.1 thiamine pyrophosphate-dependent enzyme [Dehalococcoidia bacterium]|tara:strand:- start:629 stop:1192 length:564 start_codon:yes stop_codon:yes gene_type:complete
MERQEAIDLLAEGRSGAIAVATMQSIYPWHQAEQAEYLHIDASQCMGSAASIGLGLAMARPDKRVMVLDGDGSLLMQLGSLVTVASQQPRKFFHFVFANGLHQSTGNQDLPGIGRFDWVALAIGSGYANALKIETADELLVKLPSIWDMEGPVLIELSIEREAQDPRWAGVPMASQSAILKEQLAAL